MQTREFTIKWKNGLKARTASLFVEEAGRFRCSVWMERSGRRVSGKSVVSVLSLGIERDTTVTVVTEGSDEEAAIEVLSGILSAPTAPG